MASAIFSLRYKKKCLWCCKGQSEDPEFYFYLLWFCFSTVPLPSVCLLLIWNSVCGNWSHKIECKKWGSTSWNSGLLCKELLFPNIYIFYSMCCKCQVFTNVTRMQTQSMLIFSYGKCSIKQATDNGNYVAHEWVYDLTGMSKFRHVSNPTILIFQIWHQILYCNAAECRIICTIRSNSGPENSMVTWMQRSTLTNLPSWEIKPSFSRFCSCPPSIL